MLLSSFGESMYINLNANCYVAIICSILLGNNYLFHNHSKLGYDVRPGEKLGVVVTPMLL